MSIPIGGTCVGWFGSSAIAEGFMIGRNVIYNESYASILADRVKVYNEALSDGAIRSAYNEGLPLGFFMFF